MSERLLVMLVKPGLSMRKGQAIARPLFVARMDGPEQVAALPAAAAEVFGLFLLKDALASQVSLQDVLIARPFAAWESTDYADGKTKADPGPGPDFEMDAAPLEGMRFRCEEKDGQPETKLYFTVEVEGREGQLWAARNCGKRLWVKIKS